MSIHYIMREKSPKEIYEECKINKRRITSIVKPGILSPNQFPHKNYLNDHNTNPSVSIPKLNSKFNTAESKESICKGLKPYKQFKQCIARIRNERLESSEINKLRDTNSTLCHTPKAQTFYSKYKIDEFKSINRLGKGESGTVFTVIHIPTGFIAALKIINKDDFCFHQKKRAKVIQQLTQEIKIQAYSNHNNIIKLYGFFSDDKRIYLIQQLGCDGSLYSLYQNKGKFQEYEMCKMIKEITLGVEYLHKRCIIHRDIKLENIVMVHGIPKICDFGCAVYCPTGLKNTLCGTPMYFSPQMLDKKAYDDKIDTWALGVIAYELFTGNNPFNLYTYQDLPNIKNQQIFFENGSPQLKSFINFLLRKDAKTRANATIILKHPFFQSYQNSP